MTEMVIAFDLFDIILDCVSRGNEKDAGVQPDVRSRRSRTLNSHGNRKDVQAGIEAQIIKHATSILLISSDAYYSAQLLIKSCITFTHTHIFTFTFIGSSR
jgi:hypothetical protein